MIRTILFTSFVTLSLCISGQDKSFTTFLADSSMEHGSVSLVVVDANSGKSILEYNPGISLTPASVMKLIISAAAIELLGPDYTFKTVIGYTGTLNRRSGKLSGDIIIRGGGDPALGSRYFPADNKDFLNIWVDEIQKLGIRKIEGRVLTDDSYYDFLPVPSKWLWEDVGNYYGAGAFGLSIYDNTYDIHFKTYGDSTQPIITEIVPAECESDFSNMLRAAGSSDEGYVFSAPYSTKGWLAGSIPPNMNDFILQASISDPPALAAKILTERLRIAGIKISGEPSTFRLDQLFHSDDITPLTETISHPLVDIIEVLNHESVNLYAEHLVKELGKRFRKEGSTEAGVEVVKNFLEEAGINNDGIFLEDGSGLSPLNAINSGELVKLLLYMKNSGRYFTEFYSSLPEAGKEGTLKNYFKDPVFDARLKAKSGSMTRVRSYAGYISTLSGKTMVFSIIVNNYTGPSKNIIAGIENILRDIILYK